MNENPLLAQRRREVVAAIHEVRAAAQDLKRLFDSLEQGMGDAAERIERGGNALEMVSSMGVSDVRETLNAAGSRVRKARHEVQRALFLMAEAEGASRAQIARIWRVSRQLVSRMMRETPQMGVADDSVPL